MILTLVIQAIIGIKRLHDLDKSGWWLLLYLIPIANIAMALYLLLAPGTDGPNRFGPPPPPNSSIIVFFGYSIIGLIVITLIGLLLVAIAIPEMAS